MGRLIMLAIICGIGWYCYNNGIWYNISHGGGPQPGIQGEVAGPVRDGVPMMYDPDEAKYMFDVHIGNTQQKWEAAINLDRLMKNGSGVELDEHTKVKVLDSGTIRFLGADYAIAEVEVLSGPNAGAKGWVERNNLIDTPLQQVYQAMRGTTRPTKKP